MMIKHKKKFYIALFLLFTSMALNFPFPHENPYGESIAWILDIPVRSAKGFHYVGITCLFLLIAGLYFLTKSLEKYQGRFVLLAIFISMSSPLYIASSFQKTLATGIYAVSYERDFSTCSFEMIDEETLNGVCELPFENYSRDDVHFTIEFYEKYQYEDDAPMLSLMNNGAPYKVELKAKERKKIIIETNIDVSQMENHIESGEITYVNLVIKSGVKSRKL
jgi:hypothetical protein